MSSTPETHKPCFRNGQSSEYTVEFTFDQGNIMEKEKIDRINALAKKQKETGLTDAEREEQRILREEYIEGFRKNLCGILGNTYIKNPDGSVKKVESKKK